MLAARVEEESALDLRSPRDLNIKFRHSESLGLVAANEGLAC
jgi:hypothetical protein